METLKTTKAKAMRTAVINALRQSKGEMSGAARRLGVSRVSLYRLVGKLGLDRGALPEPADVPAPGALWLVSLFGNCTVVAMRVVATTNHAVLLKDEASTEPMRWHSRDQVVFLERV